MKPATVASLIFSVLVFLPTALSIHCYVCSNNNGDCNENVFDCSTLGSSYTKCLKVKIGNQVAKVCSTDALCKASVDACKGSSTSCEATCCNGNLCNGVRPIRCYVCKNDNGNCKENDVDCSTLGWGYTKCLTLKVGNKVAKACSTNATCKAAADTCKTFGTGCKTACCGRNLCNGGLSKKPLVPVTLLVLMLTRFLK